MIAVGLLGALSYGVMQLSKSSSESQRKMSFNTSLNAMMGSIQTELSSRENCTVSLGGLAPNEEIQEIKEGMADPAAPGTFIPTSKIFMKVKNPGDRSHGMYIDKMQYVLSDDGTQDQLKVTFKAGYVNADGSLEGTKMLGSSEISKIFNLKVVKDPSSGKIQECYSDTSNLLGSLEQRICELDKKLVNSIGGTTTNCNPNITVRKLVNFVHTDTQCVDAGGQVVTLNSMLAFCKFSGTTCPGGWTQYDKWTATTKTICNATVSRGGGVNNSAWNTCLNKFQEKCGWGPSNESGGHAFKNSDEIEEKKYQTVLRVCYSPAGSISPCGEHMCYDNQFGKTYLDCSFNAGGSVEATCKAVRTQVGCF
jgi:hypothetical protein